MKFAHVRAANISHLRSKYFTAQLFHLPEGQISLKNPRLREDFSGLPDRIRTCGLKSRSLALYPAGLRVDFFVLPDVLRKWTFFCAGKPGQLNITAILLYHIFPSFARSFCDFFPLFSRGLRPAITPTQTPAVGESPLCSRQRSEKRPLRGKGWGKRDLSLFKLFHLFAKKRLTFSEKYDIILFVRNK